MYDKTNQHYQLVGGNPGPLFGGGLTYTRSFLYHRPMSRLVPVLPLVLTALLVTACQAPAAPTATVQQKNVFTTVVTLTLYDAAKPEVFETAFARMGQIESLMSDYIAGSEISRVSAQAGVAPVKVSPETVAVVKQALVQSDLTGGIFDPSIGPVTHLWDVGSAHPQVPSASAIAAAKALVNYKDVVIDDAASTIYLKRKGMRLDVGGIAKGFALDQTLAIARKAGVTSAIFNMGNSSIGFLGYKPGNKLWKIGVQDPFLANGSYFATVTGHDITVETSGPYEKFFMAEGKRYHHIMDPRTGAPADSGLEQVTLILPLDTKLADGISTSCFILGLEKGMAFIESLPEAAAIFVTHDRKVYLSSRVGDRFTLVDKTYTLGK
jgi:thiamine biosynthesis lipoprotein